MAASSVGTRTQTNPIIGIAGSGWEGVEKAMCSECTLMFNTEHNYYISGISLCAVFGLGGRFGERESQRYTFTTLNNYNYESPSGVSQRQRPWARVCGRGRGVFNKRCSAQHRIPEFPECRHMYVTLELPSVPAAAIQYSRTRAGAQFQHTRIFTHVTHVFPRYKHHLAQVTHVLGCVCDTTEVSATYTTYTTNERTHD